MHIYENHLEAVETQLKRLPNKFPILKIRNITDIDEKLEYKDFNLIEYNHQGNIKAMMSI